VLPPDESADAAKTRADKQSWLAARGYKVIDILAREVEADIAGSLERILRAVAG